jgi:CpeT protein
MTRRFCRNLRILTLLAAIAMAGACSDDSGSGPDAMTPDALTADTGPDSGPDAPAGDTELRMLASWMTGSFSSEKQSKTDLSYYHVTLDMVRVWPDRDPGSYWLYIEQAIAGSLPYRQRVYLLERVDATTVVSKVFAFASTADEQKAVGAWKQQEPLVTMAPKDLVEKTGCGVVMSKKGDIFSGATEGKTCASSLSGASYATSKVDVSVDALTSWDQGFDAADKQVWGAVTGPYIFDKLKNLSPELD